MFIRLTLLCFITLLSLFGESINSPYYISGGKKIVLHPLKTLRDASGNNKIRYFVNDAGQKMGMGRRMIICCESRTLLDKLARKYRFRYLRTLTDNLYLCETTATAKTLSICNALIDEKGVRFAHPDFMIRKHQRGIDPYYKFQWHLKNTEYPGADINVEEAWRYTKGAGVLAAVIDEGIDIDHPDLKANIVGFANYNDPGTDYPGSDTGNWHGTACIGLLGAAENSTGIVGVAPESKLLAIRYSDANVSQDILAFDDLMKQGVSVISNSWGSYANLDAYNYIFKKLATEGRGGKGILIFFATGNEHLDMDTPGINDESESPWVISIGASTHDDKIAPYSNYGSTLDFLAPGGVEGGQLVTTDAQGEKGYTDWNYNFNFVGTSAAAPIAAGVGALILSANPDLTREEVIEILKQSAVKIGDEPYDRNGRNNFAGYGRIDAGKAVALAASKRKLPANTLSTTKIDNFAHIMYLSVQKFSDK